MPAAPSVNAIIFWAAIASTLTTIGPSFQLVQQSHMQESLPAITVDASGAGVAYWNDDASRAGRFASPQPIASTIQLADGPSRDSGAASIGNQSMVVWLRNDDLWGQRIGSDGKAIGDPIYIAFTDSRHTMRMAIGASRDRYLVVWAIQTRMLASIIDTNGQIIDFAIPLMNGEYGRPIERISITSNGSEFLVAWDASTSEPWVTPCTLACPADDRDVHAIIVGDDGHPRPETEHVLAAGAGDPDVASNGHDYLVTWSRFGGGITAQTISAGFTSAGDPVTVSAGKDYGPHIAWDGSMYDVAWINADSGLVLDGVRISDTGRVGEALATGRAYAGFDSRAFDIAARDGKIVLAVPSEGHLRVQFLGVAPTVTRYRGVRH